MLQRQPTGRMLVFLLALTVCGTRPAPADGPLRPNIVLVMADDLGYGDLSCYGASTFQTPHIDRLAAEGIRFTSGYCSASTCTPTRYSLMTGNFAFRTRGTGVAPPNSPLVIDPRLDTLPAILKRAGYRTAVVGKWHLGLGGPSGPDWNGELRPGPLEIGFDSCFLLPTTNDRVPQVFVENHRVRNLDPADPLWVGDRPPSDDHPDGRSERSTLRMDWDVGHNGTIHNGISRIGYYTGGLAARFRDEDLGDEWVAQAKQFMQAAGDQPFFLFFASHDLHVPRMPHERFQGTTPHGLRTDAIAELDWSVGELKKTLVALGRENETLFLFCSDNGAVLNDGYRDGAAERNGGHRPSGPWRGGKYSVYEGGTRTPWIVSWPGVVAPGVSDEMVCTIDLARSFAALTGVEPLSGSCQDSENVLDAILGRPGAKGRQTLLLQDNGTGGSFGYRSGNWKLVQIRERSRSPEGTRTESWQLFDLAGDPAESTDVGHLHTAVLQRLKTELAEKTGR